MAAFTQGSTTKSKKQREEEAQEAKRRQLEIETNQVLEEYVADFSAPLKPKGMGFVRAGESGGGHSFLSKGFDDSRVSIRVK